MDRLTWWVAVATSDLTHETRSNLLARWDDLGDGLPRRATEGLEGAIERGYLKWRAGRWRPSTPDRRSATSAAPASDRSILIEPERAAHEVDICDACPLLAYIRREVDD